MRRYECSGENLTWKKVMESVCGTIVDMVVKKGFLEEVPRAETRMERVSQLNI